MTFVEMATALLRVTSLGLIFGAGIPILFALGMRSMTGDAIRDADGVVVGDTEASPQMKALGWSVYAVLAALIVVAILWVARDAIAHYSGLEIFGGL